MRSAFMARSVMIPAGVPAIFAIEPLVVRLMPRIFTHGVQYPLPPFSPFSPQAESAREQSRDVESLNVHGRRSTDLPAPLLSSILP